MKHCGDITKISGYTSEPVQVVIGGSPCQDLSVAGKRAGLAGERSGLFMEQIRIIKEMREADVRNGRTGRDVRPRFMVWENVPGAFSSNGGADFGAVLQETVKVIEPEAPPVPVPERGWPLAGCLFGAGGDWSVAWRVLDAQFWGVPQRRRRIALVADFGGECAPEILFERKGVCWHYPACRTAGQGTANHAEGGFDDAKPNGVRCLNPWDSQTIRQYDINGVSPCLSSNATGGQNRAGVCVPVTYEMTGFGSYSSSDVAGTQLCRQYKDATDLVCYPDTACALATRHDGGPCPDHGPKMIAFTNRGQSGGDTSETLRAESHGAIPMVCAAGFKAGQSGKARSIGYAEEQAPTLSANGSSLDPTVFCIQGNCIDRADTAGCNGKGWKEEQSYTLNTIDRPAVAYKPKSTVVVLNDQGGNSISVEKEDIAPTLRSQSHQHEPVVVYDARGNGSGNVAPTLTGDHANRVTDYTALVAAVDCRNATENTEINGTLQAKSNGGQSLNLNNTLRYGYCVRRMTPLECERLQGFPDGWTDIGAWVDSKGKLHPECTDSNRYKALGNSIALPPWLYILQRVSLCCGTDRTMASLFDGIGGFPLIWEYLNGRGSCLWASEIEEFPMAVTKYHFPDAEEEERSED